MHQSKSNVVIEQPGFVEMPIVNMILAIKSLDEAKDVAIKAINAQPTAKKENIAKAFSMVRHAKSVNSLAISISNFILAHESADLKVIGAKKFN